MSTKRPRPQKEQTLLTLFGAPEEPAKKKVKPPPPQLAVPLNVEVPAVQKLQATNVDVVTNKRTGQVKRVTKGKHATKGRGTVANAVTPVVVEPTPDEDVHEDDVDFAAARRAEEAKIAKEMATRRTPSEPSYHKPNYVDDAWSLTSVSTLRREILLREHKGPRPLVTTKVPAFYHRRERDPIVTVVKTKTSETESYCKLLTFHADGSFEWPVRSPHVCWNCCYHFDGPPAMIPRFYNRYHNVYEVYGNFCSWPCAKRYSQTLTQEYYTEHAPSLDAFAQKYFGVDGPVEPAPSHLLLEKFSSFGMTIDEYRAGANVICLVHPPCVPYELFVTWQTRTTANKKINSGYEPEKKAFFERQMQGAAPLPQMPPPVENTAPVSSSSKHKSATKKQKNLLSLFA